MLEPAGNISSAAVDGSKEIRHAPPQTIGFSGRIRSVSKSPRRDTLIDGVIGEGGGSGDGELPTSPLLAPLTPTFAVRDCD